MDPDQKQLALSWRWVIVYVAVGREVKAIERNVDYHKSDTFKMTFNVMYVDSY